MAHFLVLVVTFLLSLVICGQGLTETTPNNPTLPHVISSVRQYMKHARNVLEAQVDLSTKYKVNVNLLATTLRDIENRLAEMDEWISVSSSMPDSTLIVLPEACDTETRITILGAGALTKFKAQQLTSQLENLLNRGNDRQATLEEAVKKAESLWEEVVKLKLILLQRTPQRNVRLAVDSVNIHPIQSEPPKRFGPVRNSRANAAEDDRSTPVIMIAAASDDESGQGKAPRANSEAKYLADELKMRIDEAAKQAKVLQQLVSDIVQKTDSIKRQERQTDSKLKDMRQLTKSWDEKRIPVNKEALALENKLSSDIEIYKMSLKEVDGLKQSLGAVFNAIIRPAPEAPK